MSRGGMFNFVIFSSPLTPVALLKLTLQSCDRVRGVSEKREQESCGQLKEGAQHPPT